MSVNMDTALSEICTFISAIPPFDKLPDNVLETVIKDISICYMRGGESLPPKGVEDQRLYIVKKGAISYYSNEEELLGKYAERDICTKFCRKNSDEKVVVITDEDSLLYSIPYEAFIETVQEFSEVTAFFSQTYEERLNKKVSTLNEEAIINSSLMNTTIEDFYHAPAATVCANTSIQDAAIKMSELGFSCLVVVDNANDKPVGIITDKDIRRRCVAQGLAISSPVTDIMTADMMTIDINNSAYDALMTMTHKHIHHLPVTNNSLLAGMVTVTDLMNNEGHNAINITSMVHKTKTVEELIEISALLPKLQVRMAKLGTTADHVGKSISAITMAFTIRLIKMAEELNGPAPVPYAWLAAGSQARQEQFAHSDQDNALIISNDMQPDDDEWFIKLATFVSDGLDKCGFIYCPGDIMATNKQWRQTQKVWDQYFETWVNKPHPKALLNSSVFFDLTTVYGDVSLLDHVRANMLRETQKNTLFIAHMSKNALQLRPPLGFFRDFVLVQDGENKNVLDLKHNGIAPIVDLARIYALSQGITATNTIDRLRAAAGTRAVTKASALNLIDAYEFLGMLRMQHQAERIAAGKTPNNYLSPKKISKLEREHLKDAFKVIKTMQDARQSAY
jgi:CBS domain-containing protein